MTKPASTRRNVMLSFCSGGNVATDFMMSVHDATHAPGTRIGAVAPVRSGPVLTVARCKQAETFLNSKFEWLWIVDTDMVFSEKTLPALMEHADPEVYPVVGATCMTIVAGQMVPSMYLIQREPEFAFNPLGNWPPNALFRVDATGCGCLLIHRSVFTRINEAVPEDADRWFAEMTVERTILGEDLSFSLRCALAKIPVMVHSGVTVAHLKQCSLGEVSP